MKIPKRPLQTEDGQGSSPVNKNTKRTAIAQVVCAWCAFRLGLLCVWSAFDSKLYLKRLESYRHRCGSSHQESKRKKKGFQSGTWEP